MNFAKLIRLQDFCGSEWGSLATEDRRNRDKKNPNRFGLGFRVWWSRGESNPRPQAINGQFYMLSWLI